MKKLQTKIFIFTCIMLASMFAGFFISASSPDNVFYGLTVTIGGSLIFGCMVIMYAIKLLKLKERIKEERIKK